MSATASSSRIERLHHKASAFIDSAVASGEITASSYDPMTRTGSTYGETPTDEEITRRSDGSIFIVSDTYTYAGTMVELFYSALIPRSGLGALVIEHSIDPDENDGQQTERTVPAEYHDYIANLMLASMASKPSAEPDAA